MAESVGIEVDIDDQATRELFGCWDDEAVVNRDQDYLITNVVDPNAVMERQRMQLAAFMVDSQA